MSEFRAIGRTTGHRFTGKYRTFDNFVRYAVKRDGNAGEWYDIEIIDSITRPVYLGMRQCKRGG